MATSQGEGRSIMSDIDATEEEIKRCYHRLDVLERNLKYKAMTNDEREHGEKDVIELRKMVKNQEQQLKSLRSENRGSSAIAVVLIFLAFLCYGMYHMYKNANNEEPQEEFKLTF